MACRAWCVHVSRRSAGASWRRGSICSPAVVRHDPLDGDPLGGEPSGGPDKEHGAGVAALVRQHLDIGNAAVIVDGHMHIVISDALGALAPVKPGDAMPCLVEASELLNVQVQQIARSVSFVTAYGLWRREATEAVQAPRLESMGHGGAWEIEHFTDLVSRNWRSRAIRSRHPAIYALEQVPGALERATRPQEPSSRNRFSHLQTVRTEIPNAAAIVGGTLAVLIALNDLFSTVKTGAGILVWVVHSIDPETDCVWSPTSLEFSM